MNKCFEINKDGDVHQGILVENFTKASESITRPSVVVGGRGLGSQYGILPIHVYDNHYYNTNDEKVIRYTDKDSRVYGLWMEFVNGKPHPQFDPKLTFDNVHTSPDGFGSSNAIVAFRTHNRCIGIESYTADSETLTCIDEICRLQYIGKPRSMPRRCCECGGKVKSTFIPFPGIILTDGEACDDGDAQTGTEIVAQIPMGHAFRVVFTIDEDKSPIECYYQFNGGDIESLGQFKEAKDGSQRIVGLGAKASCCDVDCWWAENRGDRSATRELKMVRDAAKKHTDETGHTVHVEITTCEEYSPGEKVDVFKDFDDRKKKREDQRKADYKRWGISQQGD